MNVRSLLFFTSYVRLSNFVSRNKALELKVFGVAHSVARLCVAV
jgi:hypothetical protein